MAIDKITKIFYDVCITKECERFSVRAPFVFLEAYQLC